MSLRRLATTLLIPNRPQVPRVLTSFGGRSFWRVERDPYRARATSLSGPEAARHRELSREGAGKTESSMILAGCAPPVPPPSAGGAHLEWPAGGRGQSFLGSWVRPHSESS